MSYLHQAETNVAAHQMSSAEETKWRDWNEDPELLCDPYDSLQILQERKAAEERERQQAELEAQRPLSMVAAAKVMQAAEVQVQNPATAAVNLSFNVERM